MNDRLKKFFGEKQIAKTRKRIEAAITRLGFERYAEDAAQEFFCRVLEGKSQHQTVDQFAVDYLRGRVGDSRTGLFAQRKNHEYANSYEQGGYDRAISSHNGKSLDDRLDLLRMVDLLGGRDKQIAIERFIGGMSEAEIAHHHKITESRICQILQRIQSSLSKRIASPESRMARKAAKEMARILFGSWTRMEFEPGQRMAFEEPGTMAPLDGQGFEEWIA